MPINETALDALIAASEAFYAKYRRTDPPAGELKAERERYCQIYAGETAAMSPVERELDALNMKTRWLEHDADRHAELMRMLPAPLGPQVTELKDGIRTPVFSDAVPFDSRKTEVA